MYREMFDLMRQFNGWQKGWRARGEAWIDRVTGYKFLRRRFREKMGYELSLEAPKSFNEKVVWKKLHDRNPLLPITADKHRVRTYVRDVLGENRARDVLIPQLFVTDAPESIPFEELPDNYVVKANNASGRNIIVRENCPAERDIVSLCKVWLQRPYRVFHHEWAYQEIAPKIVVEKLIENEEGKIPKAFQIYMIHGQCRLIVKVSQRFNEGPSAVSFLDADFNLLPVSRPHLREGRNVEKPNNFEDMLKIAGQLADPFDMVRVDLYSIANQTFFGELTPYPLSGRGRFEPKVFDFELGQCWDLEPEYWKS